MAQLQIGDWLIGKELGSGHFAKVKLATHKETKKQVAVKILKKPEGSKIVLVEREVEILTKVKHPYIVRCYDVIDGVSLDDPTMKNKIFFFMELMEGGELFDRIVDQGHYTEAEAKETTIKLISAIKYLHDMGIAHRDLKPENMLMTNKNQDAEVKITDFGLSKFFDEQSTVMKTPCGTSGYIAPEVLKMRGYGKECDVWSLGVIVYILLCGFPPFYADNDNLLYENIKKGEFEFLRPYWDPISKEAKDLVKCMLTVDPAKRITCEQALKHPWLVDLATKLSEEIHTVTELSKGAHTKLKAAFNAVDATERMKLEASKP